MATDDRDFRETRVPVTDVNLGPTPDGSAFLDWTGRMGFLYEISLPEGANAADFRVRGHTWQLPTVVLTSVARSGLELRRDVAFIAKNPVDHVCLYFATAGTVSADCDDGNVEIRTGDVFFMDYSRPIRTLARDHYGNVTVIFTATAGPALFRNGALHGAILRGTQPEVRLLHAHLQALLSELGELSTRAADAAVMALLTLTATVMDSGRANRTRTDHRLIDRAVAVIRSQIGNSALTPEVIASELGVSRTALYRQLELYGGVRNLIGRVRLDESLKMLADLPPAGVAIKDIARRHGFISDAQFSRAFRARFGRTPREILALRKVNPKAQFYKAWAEARRAQSDFETIDAWLESITR